MVDTNELRLVAAVAKSEFPAWSAAMTSAADENDALRKRIQQLERLVCSQMGVVLRSYADGKKHYAVGRWGYPQSYEDYDTPREAIDAAITRREQEAIDEWPI